MVLAANYIGVIQFGTEQKHATSNVTFEVKEFAMNATRGTPKPESASVRALPRMEYVFALVITCMMAGSSI
jgi:xyloglucan-specific endo-beta-1,4-glucanase